jgi:hypothetical protein
VVADPDAAIGFGYAENSHLGPLAGIDSRPGRVLRAVDAALEVGTTTENLNGSLYYSIPKLLTFSG